MSLPFSRPALRLALVASLALPLGAAAKEERHQRFGDAQVIGSAGPTLSFTPRFAAGGEASIVLAWSPPRLVDGYVKGAHYVGLYADYLYEHSRGTHFLTLGPEAGTFFPSLLGLGVDGGLAVRTQGGRSDLGFALRPYVGVGPVLLYVRYLGFPGAERMRETVEAGLAIKCPCLELGGL